ncbi:hypothetical protein GJ629_12420 [Halapricum sp. CBA1109]|uniref:hypothetical protein n=1 Tax=Halapricum sp. CBA1109 TaxID=2668068 RepID=UPI0012F8F156|nr:hypothetical protein [Halapricum sp. CBA1109]MUV90603.1 hypothetical protein [Halapricum sp. CBA1109]
MDVADYDLGSDGETVAVWSVTEDGSPDQVLASVTPSSQSGTLSPFLASAIDTNQTLVAAVHSGDPTADNVLAADTAAITIETVPASVTFNDQIINDRFVDVASFSLGNNGQTLAIWSVTEDGSPGQVLGSVTLTAVSGTKSLGTSPYVRTNQTLAATIHSGEPTAANILAVDTADIAVDLNPSVGGNPPARTIDGDRLLEDITGDGSADLFDALSYYNNRNTDAIQNNPTQFDFDRDGDTGDLFDALALWNEISG